MDRSFFRRSSRDSSPLLPQHQSSQPYPLADLPPRPYTDSPSPSRRSGNSASSPLSTSPRRPHVQFSTIPAPIVSSVFLSPPPPPHQAQSSHSMSPPFSRSQIVPKIIPGAAAAAVATNPLLALSRREKAIQAQLQLLLDAQSVGLVQGRIGESNGGGDDRSSDAGSSTPTTRSIAPSPSRSRGGEQHRSGSVTRGVIPVRQPRRKKIGLKSARKGILGAMEELLAVKEHEGVVVDEEISSLKSLLEQVNGWEGKIASFEQEMRRISEGTEGREMGELKTERSAVETEIRELEERLMNLRARERHLSRRIEEVGNKTEAEMSSFRGGRRGVESEVNDFLRRPPVLEVAIAVMTRQAANGVHEEETFLSLPPKRRSLEMARDWLSSTLSVLSAHREATEKEKEALEQGATMWNDTMSLVMTFEEDLRVQMSRGNRLSVRDLKQQLVRMGTIVRDIERKASEAEDKRWNLLICAIGAELEAFREGEGLLRGVLAALDPTTTMYDDDAETPNGQQDITGLDSQKSMSSSSSNGAGNMQQQQQGEEGEYLKHSNGNQSSVDNYTDAREELLVGVGLHRDESSIVDDGGGGGGGGESRAPRSGEGEREEVDVEQEQPQQQPQWGDLRRMNSSPYRSSTTEGESEEEQDDDDDDDGPPPALLVGVLPDEDDG